MSATNAVPNGGGPSTPAGTSYPNPEPSTPAAPAVPAASRSLAAVFVRGARKRYTPNVWVLDGLNMTVPQASIYALLGASGCGKTTLLTCVLGLRHLNAGSTRVMGWRPGEQGSGIPGPRLGYMPQELALSEGFSIEETMTYFGLVAGLGDRLIEERSAELIKFLDIPSKKRLISQLSGGQKQRVSLAIALLHKPPLLILDEPTVGVDPILRQSIWDYLVNLTATNGTTVLITTHYIEEARQANKVGLMRQGRLLDEDGPEHMMLKNNCDTLEEVFLRLSLNQEQNQLVVGASVDTGQEDVVCVKSAPMKTKSNVWPCVWWGALYLRRYKAVTGYVLMMPVFCLLMYLLAVGRDPTGLSLAVVNEDSPSQCGAGSMPTWPGYPHDCQSRAPTELSCRFLSLVQQSYQHVLEPYADMEAARRAVLHGEAWGLIHFPSNFSYHMMERQLAGQDATDEDLDGSEFNVQLDMSNQYIGTMLLNALFRTAIRFHDDLQAGCGLNTRLAAVPIRMEEPIYGPKEPTFQEFALPGCLLIMMFFPAIFYSTAGFMEDKLNGISKRSAAVGVTQWEVLLARAIVDCTMTVIVTIIVLVTTFVTFPFHNNGSYVLLFLLLFLCGISGLWVGYFVASVCSNSFSATFFGVGIFLVTAFISGMVWPTEGMHWLVLWGSHFSPLQLATEAVRSIIAQGSNPVDITMGFVAAIGWVAGLIGVTILILKLQKSTG